MFPGRVNRRRLPDVPHPNARRGTDLTTAPAGRRDDPSEDLDGLFEQHYDRLVRSLSVAAGSREVARDAVQEAFVKAHLRWHRIAGYEDPVGWIRRVALNRITDHHRRRGRTRRLLPRLVQRDDVEDEAVRVVDRVDLDEALRGLPDRQRVVVSLYYLEGLSVAATAAEMRVSAGSVKTHLARARAALKPVLEVI